MNLLCLRNLPLLFALLLAACAQNPPAPVKDLTTTIPPAGATDGGPQSSQTRAAGSYTVQAGDSLYSIAFRNQLDWQKLAQWNGIGAPYVIQPGQQLSLAAPTGAPRVVGQGVITQGVASQAPSVVRAVVVPTQHASVAEEKPLASRAAPVTVTPSVATDTTVTVPPAVEVSQPAVSGLTQRTVAGVNWSWPVQGPLLDRYDASDPTRQGVDIGGRRGAPIKAAADGMVVYSGNGLVGYGELVIVKHSDMFLSAYGHNSKRLVAEGDRVRAGQTIAEMGSSGTSRIELHFEIRKQGKPVDPLAFLPAL